MSINNDKLESLKDYILGGGSTEEADMLAQLETKKVAVVDEYVAALKEMWPEQFGGVEKEEEPEEEYTFWLMKEDKTLQELEKFRSKGSRITFKVKEPRDEVEIIVAGKSETVDLIQLRKDPVRNVKLIYAAEIAKG